MDMFYVHDDIVITSAKEDMFSSLFVCLLAKKCERICMKFSGKVANGPLKKMINFGGDPDHRLDTGFVFRILPYWEIRKCLRKCWLYWFARWWQW